MGDSNPATNEQIFSDHICKCDTCLAYLDALEEQQDIAALKQAIENAAVVLANRPSLWTRGDGRGGYVANLLREAMERWGMEGFRNVRQPRPEVLRIADRDGWDCAYCGIALAGKPDRPEPHVDHVIPKSRGGRNWLENKVLACPTCNMQKGARTPEEWLGKS
jgi:hypothetical protein